MPEVRKSLTEAAAILGIAPNSVRSRWKAGKVRGERDNANKIWVWIDLEAVSDRSSVEGSDDDSSIPSKKRYSNHSKSHISNPSIDFELNALQDHLKTLKEQLATTTAEVAELRAKAVDAERLGAEKDGLQGQLSIRAEQVASLMAEMDRMRPKVEETDQLRAEKEGLQGQLVVKSEQLNELRQLLGEAKASHGEELARLFGNQPTKGFFARLFSRK